MTRALLRTAALTAALTIIGLGIGRVAPAQAAITGVFAGHTVSGLPAPCVAQPDGTRVCHGDYSTSGAPDTRLASFDGVPLAFYVTLPAAPAGADGHYPLIILSHGWDEPTTGPQDTQYYGPTADAWARDGYAVVQLVARGFGDSCGTAASRLADPAGCANGYIRLDDERYEARDAQYAAGLLVDEGVVDPAAIGATGESYGGGLSLELATLRNRIMNANGTLSPWTSPDGTPLSIAAAAPVIPWSDLVYSLVPNGRTLDDQITSPTADLSPIGVEKLSFVSGLFGEGNTQGYYAPPGSNPGADLTTWYGSLNAGEPYDSNPEDQSIVAQIAQFHSPYYLLDGAYGTPLEAPAPLLLANGFTDDLFPVDEALRFQILEHHLYPSDPISLFDWDGGHERGQNKTADNALLSQDIQAFFDHQLKGAAAPGPTGFTALTQTCPKTAPSGGPYTAPTWAGLHPGEVNDSSPATQTISSSAGNPQTAQAVDPITGPGACATASATDQGPGVATYRLPAASGAGYTLLGSPTVRADLTVTGSYAFIAARLWDVDPSTNTETLVDRGLYRIDPSAPDGVQVFQLHPGAWHFAAGHIPKLELLGQDSPYARTSNGQFTIAVSDLLLRLPVHERPGSAPGIVAAGPPLRPGPGPGSGSGSGSASRPPAVGRPTACRALPSSRLTRRGVHVARGRTTVTGTASPGTCRAPRGRRAGTAANRERPRRGPAVRRVWVAIYRTAPRGRCRYLTARGLLRPRSCRRPVRFLARGTSHWRLSRRLFIPPGVYLVRVTAVDAAGRAQRPSGRSVVLLRVPRARRRRR